MNRLLIGVIVGMVALASSGWAVASRSHARSLTLAARVTRLESIARTQLKIDRNQQGFNQATINRVNGFATSTSVAFATTDSSGAAFTTAFCPSGKQLTGGGVAFLGNKYASDRVIYSFPNGDGWSAAANGSSAGRTLEVFAVCARL
jgi:hypothetical protein